MTADLTITVKARQIVDRACRNRNGAVFAVPFLLSGGRSLLHFTEQIKAARERMPFRDRMGGVRVAG